MNFLEDFLIAGAVHALLRPMSPLQHAAAVRFLMAAPPWILPLPPSQVAILKLNMERAELATRGPCTCPRCMKLRDNPRMWN